jgi:hypothetical protein
MTVRVRLLTAALAAALYHASLGHQPGNFLARQLLTGLKAVWYGELEMR